MTLRKKSEQKKNLARTIKEAWTQGESVGNHQRVGKDKLGKITLVIGGTIKGPL